MLGKPLRYKGLGGATGVDLHTRRTGCRSPGRHRGWPAICNDSDRIPYPEDGWIAESIF